MKNIKNYLFLLFVTGFLFIGQTGYGQCTISQQTNNIAFTSTQIFGQSFTACQTGQITSIEVDFFQLPTGGTVDLQIQAGLGTITPNYTQLITPVLGTNTITLTTPFSVQNGQTYSFSFVGPGHALQGTLSDAYPGGVRFIENSGSVIPIPSQELVFEVTIAPPPTTVPTLSQWGLILLALGMVSIGTVVMWRKRYSIA